jgi:hypothetical protein
MECAAAGDTNPLSSTGDTWAEFAPDSLLEEGGFEPLVPLTLNAPNSCLPLQGGAEPA